MTESSAVDGSCLCGAVRFAVAMPSQFHAHCHCTLCQRAHGAAYVTWIGVASEQLTMHSETTLTHFASSDHGTRSFCQRCGSQLFCRSTHHPERVDIVVAALTSAIDRAPQGHFYFSDHAYFADVSDRLPRFGGATGAQPLDTQTS